MYKLTVKTLMLSLFLLMTQNVFSVELIVNKKNDVDSLSQKEIRGIFTMRQSRWSNGESITVYSNDLSSSNHHLFVKKFLDIMPHRLNSFWERKRYSGLGKMPEIKNNDSDIISAISNDIGGIGYVSEVPQEAKNNVKIIEMR